MKKLIILSLLLNLSKTNFCQVSKYNLVITPFIRYDRQNAFFSWESVLDGKNYVKHSGVSYGLNLNVRRELTDYNSISLGVGFYKHTVNNIDRSNENESGNDRLIKFPSPLFIPFYTDNYSYNTMTCNISFQQELKLLKQVSILLSPNASILYTFSQEYHLISNPEGSTKFKKKNSDMFGILAGLDFGISFKNERWIMEPKFKIPILTTLKTDEVFPNENGTEFRRQYFSGIGFGISFIYALKPTKK